MRLPLHLALHAHATLSLSLSFSVGAHGDAARSLRRGGESRRWMQTITQPYIKYNIYKLYVKSCILYITMYKIYLAIDFKKLFYYV